MIAEHNTYMYSFDYPDGKLFIKGEEIPKEFEETPALLGLTRDMTKSDIEKICAVRGSKKTVVEAVEIAESDPELEATRIEYEKALGVKPHHRKTVETMKAEINASQHNS